MIDSNLYSQIISLNSEILKEADLSTNFKKVLFLAQKICQCDGAFLYVINNENFLSLEYCHIKSLMFEKLGAEAQGYFPTTFLPEVKPQQLKTCVQICALNKEIINIENIFNNSNFDKSNIENFDTAYNYATTSILCLPIINRKNEVVAVAQFINAQDSNGKNIAFIPSLVDIAAGICSNLSLLLENKQLEQNYTKLLESFIEVLARAIDYKSPYTGAHCQRVPVITRMLATAVAEHAEGSLKNFEMSEDDWYTLHIASWLHDCGKLTTPEYIMDKASKLETIYNRIHEIRNRFEILRRDAHIKYLKNRINDTAPQEVLQAKFVEEITELENDFAHIAKCNTGDIAISKSDVEKLKDISQKTFTRYFSRIKGLSWAELNNIEDKELFDKPSVENLLQNRKDQKYGNFNLGELYNLSVESGTINKEEREKINEHIVMTIEMLEALPFPKEFSKVVEYAGAHHERIDGKGYPNGLTGDQMSVPAKIMAVADIFEALTSVDRPYKVPKTLSEVLKIMQEMKNSGHIDKEIYSIFLNSKVYLDYAQQYLAPEQIDDFNQGDFV